MKKILIVALVLVVVLTMAAGCSSPADSAPAPAPASEAPKSEEPSTQPAASSDMVIGVSMDELQNTFWVAAKKGMDEAAAKYGAKLEYRTCEGDAVKQNAQIEELIAAGVDAIVVVYADRLAILQGVKAANDAGVPIVYCDRPIEKTDEAGPDWGVATDEYALCRAGWEWTIGYAKENGSQLKVLEVVGSLNDKNVLIRSEVTAAVAEENTDTMEVVQQVLTEWDLEKTLAGTTNALQADPEINCIFMHYDGLLDPIATALKQAGKWVPIGEDGHVILMPYSGNESGMKAMIDGYADMCFGMNTIGEGYQAVEACVKLINGENPGAFAADPGFIITQANLQELGPQTYGWPQ